jgi:hypothetical protein
MDAAGVARSATPAGFFGTGLAKASSCYNLGMESTRVGRLIRLVAMLIGVGFIALWVRSHLSSDLLFFTTRGGRYVEVAAIPDQFRITVVDRWPGWPVGVRISTRPPSPIWPVFGQGLISHRWFPLGFAVTHGARPILLDLAGANPRSALATYSQWAIPFPLPVLICAAIVFQPLVRRLLRRRREGFRVARGFCSQCGYDLRASTGRCPECGTERDPRLMRCGTAAPRA